MFHTDEPEREVKLRLPESALRKLDALDNDSMCGWTSLLTELIDRAHDDMLRAQVRRQVALREADQPAPTETLNAEDSAAFQQLLNAPAQVVPALAEALRKRRLAHAPTETETDDRPPGSKRIDVYLSDDGESLAFPGGRFTTVRACRHCGVLISGGPTACLPCAAKPDPDYSADPRLAHAPTATTCDVCASKQHGYLHEHSDACQARYLAETAPDYSEDPRLAHALANPPGPRHARLVDDAVEHFRELAEIDKQCAQIDALVQAWPLAREALASARLDGETVPLVAEPQGAPACCAVTPPGDPSAFCELPLGHEGPHTSEADTEPQGAPCCGHPTGSV